MYLNISYFLILLLGLLFAIICSRLITSDTLRVRQLGVIFWQLRDVMDDLDGWVARKRNVELGFKIQTSSFGYYKDGLFDAAGTIFLLFGKICRAYFSGYTVQRE